MGLPVIIFFNYYFLAVPVVFLFDVRLENELPFSNSFVCHGAHGLHISFKKCVCPVIQTSS